MDIQQLKTLVEAEKDWIISMRRKLHRIPEVGFAEFKTQRAIMDALERQGADCQLVDCLSFFSPRFSKFICASDHLLFAL